MSSLIQTSKAVTREKKTRSKQPFPDMVCASTFLRKIRSVSVSQFTVFRVFPNLWGLHRLDE